MEAIDQLLAGVEQVIVGKREVARLLLVALLCEGHVLIEDVPGVGKTLLAKTLAACLDCSFRRLQFTPDMLPSDITGSHVFNQQTAQFEFRPGPVFASVLLADEINRATPRTQSALLEAMEERQVSVDGVTMPLPRPFLVAATQNPVELEGTFPLPEAQLDRFLLKIQMGYPDEREESQILLRFAADDPLPAVKPIVDARQLQDWQTQRGKVRMTDDVREYLVKVVRSTRNNQELELGASPRAALALYRACQAWAALEGRDYVLPDDVKRLAGPVLVHRLILSPAARLRGSTAEKVIAGIVQTTPVPVEPD
ncbi:MAG TPA: MoxR family ATPase [Chloroflexota bacterium]|jgi:MoxR-like ATPase|nr:MoxR family ATPase [Chloroflexota bacterium]